MVVRGSAWRAAICTSRSGNTGVERGHEERSPQHVRMHSAEALHACRSSAPTGVPCADRVAGRLVAAGSGLMAFADREVDRWRPGNQRDRGRLVALPEDLEGAVARSRPRSSTLVAQASLRRKPLRPSSTARAAWSRSYCSAVNRNTPSSERSKPRAFDGWTWGRRTYLRELEHRRSRLDVGHGSPSSSLGGPANSLGGPANSTALSRRSG